MYTLELSLRSSSRGRCPGMMPGMGGTLRWGAHAWGDRECTNLFSSVGEHVLCTLKVKVVGSISMGAVLHQQLHVFIDTHYTQELNLEQCSYGEPSLQELELDFRHRDLMHWAVECFGHETNRGRGW
eukprot:2451793-Amphidinium_carterae.1